MEMGLAQKYERNIRCKTLVANVVQKLLFFFVGLDILFAHSGACRCRPIVLWVAWLLRVMWAGVHWVVLA